MKIVIQPNQNLYFISDPHYGHKNIVREVSEWSDTSRCRDFNDVERMNHTIVDSINSTVRENDILFCLGDWSFGGVENVWKFRKRLVCKNIHLVLGNHDHHIRDNTGIPGLYWEPTFDGNDSITDTPHDHTKGQVRCQELFSSVNEYLNLSLRIQNHGPTVDKLELVLFHFPIHSWDGIGKGVMHLHGHVHLPPDLAIGTGKYMDVGMDGSGFKPLSIRAIKRILEKRPIKPAVMPKDYHI